MMCRLPWVFVLWAVCAALVHAQFAVPVGKPRTPITEAKQVVIVSIDGLRPDLALRADMPTLRGMLARGSYSFWARTTPLAITLPSHTSMLTGVTVRKHGVEWNRELPLSEAIYPVVPTIFEMATRAGYVTAMVAGKGKFTVLNKPGAITHPVVLSRGNAVVTAAAVEIIEAHKPQLLFVHYPDVDGVGHAIGWGTPEQVRVIEATDRELEKLLLSLERAGLRDSTVVIVTSDHGGAGKTHGPDDARSRHIPWVISGPGVVRGLDLTQIEKLEINTEDTAATACWLLGLPVLPYFDGKLIAPAFAPVP